MRATRTNTPLQALALMNDVTYVEAARVLAERVMAAPDPTRPSGSRWRSAGSRRAVPSAAELQTLVRNLERQLAHFRAVPAATRSRSSRWAKRLVDEGSIAGELAAYTTVASLILNLDEAITKE